MAESSTTEPVTTNDGNASAPEAPPAKRRMKRSTRIGLIIVLVVALLAAAAFLTYYILDTRNYVSTDNAQIDGDQISINAPTSGTLVDWRGTAGTPVHRDDSVGRIEIEGGFVQPQMVIRAPADGVIALNNGVEGTYYTAGTQLAVAYDGQGIYITARVDETDVDDVAVGQPVDISVDAFPDAGLTGRVIDVQDGAAGQFSLFPQSNTTGNFQKVTQVIPVRVAIDNLKNLPLAPGMNVTVKIKRV
jgi:multidrug resistance efflux pump